MTTGMMAWLMIGLVFATTGTAVLIRSKGAALGYQRAEAVVEDVVLSETPGLIKPRVTFTAEGRAVTRDMVLVNENAFKARAGDKITVLWKRSGAMGLEGWSVLPDQDGVTQTRGRVMRGAGLLFLIVGAGIIVVDCLRAIAR